jgi:hypothetical protein
MASRRRPSTTLHDEVFLALVRSALAGIAT